MRVAATQDHLGAHRGLTSAGQLGRGPALAQLGRL